TSKPFATPARLALATAALSAACSGDPDPARTPLLDAAASSPADAPHDAPNDTAVPGVSGAREAAPFQARDAYCCPSDATHLSGDAASRQAGADTTVTAFSQAHVFFSGNATSGNQRSIDRVVEFPDAALSYDEVTLHFTLSCPNGGCDAWDRRAFLGVVHDPG